MSNREDELFAKIKKLEDEVLILRQRNNKLRRMHQSLAKSVGFFREKKGFHLRRLLNLHHSKLQKFSHLNVQTIKSMSEEEAQKIIDEIYQILGIEPLTTTGIDVVLD